MIRTFTFALGAIVLATGIASSQTQAPTTSGGQAGTPTTGTRQSSTRNQKPTTAGSTTYTGCLQGTAAEGYTISVLPNGASQRSASAGTAGAQTYMVMPGSGVTSDLSTMANKRVQIVGTLAPETGMGASTGASGNSGANAGTASTGGVGTSGAGRTAAGGGNTNAGGNTNQGGDTNAGGNTNQGGNTNAGGNTNQGGNTNAGGNTNQGGNTNAGGNTAAGGYGNSGANTTAQSATHGNMANMGAGAHRTVTITSVRVVPGSCSQ